MESRRSSEEDIQDLKSFLTKEKARFNEMFNKKIVYKVELNDFEMLQTIGVGSYGRVLLSRHKATDKFYALKVIEKKGVVEKGQVEHTLYEKKILQSINSRFIVYMIFAFSDNSYLYFVLPLITGGDMFTLLRKWITFDEDLAKFYAAQVVLGFEYLHYLDVVYRDLKPENLLIDSTGYLRITDLGFCKIVRGRTWTLCGTPEYLAPEIILNKGYGNSVDWWALGVLCYEMCCGHTPFKSQDPMMVYDKIVLGKFKTPTHVGNQFKDFLNKTIQVNLTKRIGNLKNGPDDIKHHDWFETIDWNAILNHKIVPPYVPQSIGSSDTSNFDHYDEEPFYISKTEIYSHEFVDF